MVLPLNVRRPAAVNSRVGRWEVYTSGRERGRDKRTPDTQIVRFQGRAANPRYSCGMPLKSIRAWLGVDRPEREQFAPLGEILDALDHLEPDRARYLGAFAYLLGRIAHADQHVSAEETSAMEVLVRDHGQLPEDQAKMVVRLAQTSSLLFGGTANFLVAREFAALATYDQKLALMRCVFEVSATNEGISTAEEGEIHRIANELRIDPPDLVALRVAHRKHLPGMR